MHNFRWLMFMSVMLFRNNDVRVVRYIHIAAIVI